MATQDEIPAPSDKKVRTPELNGKRKWGKSIATFFTTWSALIAAVLTIAGLLWGVFSFNEQQVANQRQALDQQQQATLDGYINAMSDLLLKENLHGSMSGDVVRQVAEAQTLTALQNLNSGRKGILLRFLYESGLITNQANDHLPIIDLSYADLSYVDLSNGNLSGADLEQANLYHANLSAASLFGTDLAQANLNNADLHGALLLDGASLNGAFLSSAILDYTHLSGADMRNADLSFAFLEHALLYGPTSLVPDASIGYADLSGADLYGADLKDATVTKKQLAQAMSLQSAIMPDGTKHP